jgi:hypothetical protein
MWDHAGDFLRKTQRGFLKFVFAYCSFGTAESPSAYRGRNRGENRYQEPVPIFLFSAVFRRCDVLFNRVYVVLRALHNLLERKEFPGKRVTPREFRRIARCMPLDQHIGVRIPGGAANLESSTYDFGYPPKSLKNDRSTRQPAESELEIPANMNVSLRCMRLQDSAR